MNLIYFTSKKFPATTADHAYIESLAHSFSKKLGDAFVLLITGEPPPSLEGMHTRMVRIPHIPPRSLYYFLWFPFFLYTSGLVSKKTVFFSNEQHLLAILIFWRRVLRAQFRVCSDWHLMTETWRDTYVARGSDYLVTTSKRLKDGILERTGVEESNVAVVYGGVDLAQYSTPLPSRTELGLPEEAFLFGYVGLFKSLGNEKGLRTMITALKSLPDTVHAAFVGGTKQEIEEYGEFARSEGVAERCVWIEKQPQELVQAYQRSMDVLVIPYPNQKHFRDYGFPMKAYEYLAAGRPIAYSQLAILDEVLSKAGVSFAPEDPETLSRALLMIKEQGGAGNTQEMVREYSWDKKAERILSLLTENRH